MAGPCRDSETIPIPPEGGPIGICIGCSIVVLGLAVAASLYRLFPDGSWVGLAVACAVMLIAVFYGSVIVISCVLGLLIPRRLVIGDVRITVFRGSKAVWELTYDRIAEIGVGECGRYGPMCVAFRFGGSGEPGPYRRFGGYWDDFLNYSFPIPVDDVATKIRTRLAAFRARVK